ncbi:MAG: dNTP triphosphohydrolase [Rickettsiaceae bacterium]|nr:dNTP triphosphohydrolase [Rickettsiaceae bacterium]
MKKAQVFSLEQNESVRNRLTHSLEVADIGKTIAREVGRQLVAKKIATQEEALCLETIVENACLIHDIGNPPFGHFGEEAIKKWFTDNVNCLLSENKDFKEKNTKRLLKKRKDQFNCLYNFDGNPQGFRIVTKLHTEIDRYGLNLTYSTLLASIKYPIWSDSSEYKKIGIFTNEAEIYNEICKKTKHNSGKRYFAVYLMELADDICYCLSDIADAFEKGIINYEFFKKEMEILFKEDNIDINDEKYKALINIIIRNKDFKNFSHDIAIGVAQDCIASAITLFIKNIESYLNGSEEDVISKINSGKVLKCFKKFSKKFIYNNTEVQKLEIAGHRIVWGLLDHYGKLLKISNDEFLHFVNNNQMKNGLDFEWRVYNRISKRMIDAYKYELQDLKSKNNFELIDEWLLRCRLIIDYISGMTDQSALRYYQNVMGISLD